MKVAIQNGERFIYEDLMPAFANGGEGSIHRFENPKYIGLCVKIYHRHRRQGLDASERFAKVQAQVETKGSVDISYLAWPQHLVFDESGQEWLGYTMPYSSGFLLEELCHFQMVKEAHQDWTRSDLAQLSLGIVGAISELHKAGMLVGDVNPRNFLINPETKGVILIDCDSLHIRHEGRVYPCTVFVPNQVAPEFSAEEHPASRNTVESELFAVGILLARMWLLGKHPFSCVVPEGQLPSDYTEEKNIRAGRCPLRVNSTEGIPPGPWGAFWMALPPYLQKAFEDTLVAGVRHPYLRISLERWFELFSVYLIQLKSTRRKDRHVRDTVLWITSPWETVAQAASGGQSTAFALGAGMRSVLVSPRTETIKGLPRTDSEESDLGCLMLFISLILIVIGINSDTYVMIWIGIIGVTVGLLSMANEKS